MMAASSKKTWIVTPFDGEPIEVSGTKLEVDPLNSNRIVIYDGEDVVMQHNEAKSAVPKK
jgi:hypothetical protein